MPERVLALRPVERYMSMGVPSFSVGSPVKDIESHILNHPSQYRKVNFIYLNDNEGKLIGLISLHRLLELRDSDRIEDHINKDVRVCHPTTTVEHAVSLAIHHDITDLPIVSKEGHLLGILTAETMLSLISKLYASRVTIHAGISHEKLYELVLKGSVPSIVRARFPWLAIGLFGGLISATFLGLFEKEIERNVILALFIPMIVYLAGAVNVQSETLFIRAMALKEKIDIPSYILRDMIVTILLGSLIGLIVGLSVFLWKGDAGIATVVGVTMLTNFSLASPVAIAIPTIFRKLGKDPALGTGPLATIIQDLASLAVYFFVAYLLLDL